MGMSDRAQLTLERANRGDLMHRPLAELADEELAAVKRETRRQLALAKLTGIYDAHELEKILKARHE